MKRGARQGTGRGWSHAVLAAAMAVTFTACREKGMPANDTHSTDTPQHLAADHAADTDEWPARLQHAVGSELPDDVTLQAFAAAPLTRERKIALLVEQLPAATPQSKLALLDLLGALRPIEAVAPLVEMLRREPDAATAARFLDTLRAATQATSPTGGMANDPTEMAVAFEAVQQVFRDELSLRNGAPERLREAITAIADVFPADEAESLFAGLAAEVAAGVALPLDAPELYGLWLEFRIGSANGRDFHAIDDFVLQHPQALADEGSKLRVIELLEIAPRPREPAALDSLLTKLEPAPAADDGYVRWLALKSRVTGAADCDPLVVVHHVAPLHQAALIHYAGIDFRLALDGAQAAALRDGLIAAAKAAVDPGERAFLAEAAAELAGEP